jgi:pilus assembly protein Flp/PilA
MNIGRRPLTRLRLKPFRAMIMRRLGDSPWLRRGAMSVRDTMRLLARDENGAALVEYTTLIGILVVAVIATILGVGGWVSGQWTTFLGLLP